MNPIDATQEEVVKAHGGAILVDSEPGRGSTFSVLLPSTERRSLPAPRDVIRAAPCRVLIVDDEPLVRAHARRLLNQHGFRVEEATDGNSGLAAIGRSRPELVILDLMLPDLDGVEVVRRLRATGVDVPVVLCSGGIEAARKRGLDEAQVQGLLQKPFEGSQLLDVIARARG